MQIKKLSETAIIPTRGSDGAAGYDLYSTENYVLKPGERHLFKTDIALCIPHGFFGRICPRSGLAYKNGISVMGGIIDEDFRGNIGVILLNTSKNVNIISQEVEGGFTSKVEYTESLKINKGERIAQIIFEQYAEVNFIEVEELDNTLRGETGYGASGK